MNERKLPVQILGLELIALLSHLEFDKRPICFSPERLLGACPFLKRIE
ncbi:hypothetical protein Ga0003345_0018 [Idiomarinaceae bacterium HL-53]|nr:hypothetical protein Ga0003345_0018 [Idiomarinaceae bacterium HL-53]